MEKIQLCFSLLLLATLCVGLTHARKIQADDRLQYGTGDQLEDLNQRGHCPDGFSRYNQYDDPGCSSECKGDQDCSNGEMCCVGNPDSESICPVCKPPVYGVGCRWETYYEDEYYEDKAIFSPEWGGCAICQCRNGDVNCFNTCDKMFALREWAVPGITAAVTLLIVLIASFFVCCCVKCCCKTRERTVHYGPGVTQFQRPQNLHPPQHIAEDRAPLTHYAVA